MTAYAFILAGGRGERLWPLSTTHHPKQFISLFGGKSLLAHAVDRLAGLIPPERTYVITSVDLLPATRSALPLLPSENIIGEPLARDTAAAVALACGTLMKRDPAATAIILPADHLISDVPAFQTTLADALAMAQSHDAIITLGIPPIAPSTAYGYIECGPELPSPGTTPFRAVRRFVEKPDLPTAQAYLRTGAFVWNAGIFIWRATTMATAIRTYAPQWAPLVDTPDALGALYPTLPKSSIDYALIEKSPNLIVARGDFGWDDVGTHTALASHLPTDPSGNVTHTPLHTLNATHCTILNDGSPRTTALIDVDDLLVVHTPQTTLICPKTSAHKIKDLLPHLPPDLK